ncbi:translocation/assembly module TamB domain-containing protein [Bdellovibrio sp. HCB-110]|uniref:translocation/assembly module TamB domain-containing protein n=1 Tax=Bdellovibrio sp. HCB-110 TaxID=3391182 RepID=UPI0039B6B940
MKKLLLALLGLFVLLIGALLLLWFNLGWVLNETNARRGVEYAKLNITWDSLQIEIGNRGFFSKDIHLLTRHLCLKHPKPLIDACLEKADVAISLTVLTHRPFVHLEKIYADIVSSKLEVTIPPSPEPEPTEPFKWPKIELGSLDSLLSPYFAYLPLQVVEKISVQLKDVRLHLPPEQELLGKVSLVSEGGKLQLEAHSELIKQNKTFLSGDLKATLDLAKPLALNGTADVQLPTFDLSNQVSFSWQEFPKISTKTLLQKKDLKVSANIQADLQKTLWSFHPQANITYKALPFKKVLVENCPLKLHLQKGLPELLESDCEIVLDTLKKRPLKGLPDSLHFKTALRAPISIKNSNLTVTPSLEVALQETGIANFDLQASARTSIDLTKKKIQELSIQTLNADLQVPRFENVVALLDKSRFPVPAPLNVLKGSIRLTVSGTSTDLLKKELPIQAILTTDLTSSSQILKTESKFDVQMDFVKPLFTLGGTISLKEIELQLPYIGLQSPPQFKPDSRFVKGDTKKASAKPSGPSKFKITELKIQTEDKPILLHTNLIPNPIPVRLQYAIRNPMELSGKVAIGKMNVEIFKKKAVIEKFDLIKYKDSTVQDIDGLITHRTSEVLIQILIVGTTEKPRVEFLSDPPLSRQQIISILLFNKSLQQLANEELSTAGQLDQALLSEAFGLASLFLLSSTPIESVYFDPRTQSYTARVRLDDSTSLSLGSNFETSQQFTLRRRLGGPWSVSTQIQQTENTEDVITTLIEWFKRF